MNCEYCLKEYKKEEKNCTSCGGNIHVLEPWVLQCGWCNSSNRRDETVNCTSCGGELPNIPGSGRAPKPPQPTREITKEYRKLVMFKNNVPAKIGWAFIVIFCWSIIFPIIGIFMVRYARKKAKRKLQALENGIATKGEITEVIIDKTQASNGKNPLQIKYKFEIKQGEYFDQTESWDYSNLERPTGEHIWVVYEPLTPEINNMWPPMR